MAQYVLEILDGERAGDVIRLSDRLRIGRKPVNDLVINDEKTSGVHAEVVLEGDRHVLRDLGSTNGTLMDGKKLSEVVLTPGDIFQAGRVRLCFRSEAGSAPATGAAEEGLTLHRVDQAMLQRARRGRSAWLIGAVGLVAIGAAAWQFLIRDAGTEGGNATGGKPRTPLEVAGNRLPGNAGACEEEAHWELRGAGTGFSPASPGHTGAGMFEATRGEGDDFAMARLLEPITVAKDRPFTLAAHVRTRGAGQVGVRFRFFASGGNAPVFRTGTKLESHDGWEKIVCTAAVPAGADRLDVELVALVPDAQSAAQVDDVALTEGGDGKAVELTLETGQKLIATGSAVAVTSTDPNQPIILHAVAVDPAAPMQGLFRAGHACLSDQGRGVSAEKNDLGFALTAQGANALTLEFPADAAAGLLQLKGDGTFQGAPNDGELKAKQLLLGDGLTRCLIELKEETQVTSKPAGQRHRLKVEANQCELVLVFRAERQEADGLLKSARAQSSAEPGKALDSLRRLQNKLPHDTDTLRQAQTLRGELQQRLTERLQQLAKDMDEAAFFDTRGGFQRVVEGIDDVKASFGENNLEDAAAVAKVRQQAAERIATLDGSRTADARKRLQDLARLFAENGMAEMAKLVQDYLSSTEKKEQGSNGGSAHTQQTGKGG